ncbi:Protein of unknown function [Gryllus bimaculatus]|nr:Protein of unknown function [Gryllus bimaculatus]
MCVIDREDVSGRELRRAAFEGAQERNERKERAPRIHRTSVQRTIPTSAELSRVELVRCTREDKWGVGGGSEAEKPLTLNHASKLTLRPIRDCSNEVCSMPSDYEDGGARSRVTCSVFVSM